MHKPSSPAAGVRSQARRALGAAAVAGVAGLALAPAAFAADVDAPVATAPGSADVQEVSGVAVDARKATDMQSGKYTAPLVDTPRWSALLGFAATAVSLGLTFVPPPGSNTLNYEVNLIAQAALMLGAGFMLKAFARSESSRRAGSSPD